MITQLAGCESRTACRGIEEHPSYDVGNISGGKMAEFASRHAEGSVRIKLEVWVDMPRVWIDRKMDHIARQSALNTLKYTESHSYW